MSRLGISPASSSSRVQHPLGVNQIAAILLLLLLANEAVAVLVAQILIHHWAH
jgi:hypothetical protein